MADTQTKPTDDPTGNKKPVDTQTKPTDDPTGNKKPVDTQNNPADDLAGKLNRTKEVESWLKKLEILLDNAKRCGLDNTDVNNGFETLKQARGKYYATAQDLSGAYEDLRVANNSLTDALAKARVGPIPTLKYLSFQSMIYGWTALATSTIAAIIFILLLFRYEGMNMNHLTDPLITIPLHWLSWSLPSKLLDVPLWAALFGGLGACVQIQLGVVADIRDDGVVSDYKRVWYFILPLVALVLGYFAYILIDLGLVTLGSPQGGQSASITAANISLIKATGANSFHLINNVSGNYSFAAGTVANLTATGVSSFTANVGNQARIVACFLAGYATDAFTKKLTNLADKM